MRTSVTLTACAVSVSSCTSPRGEQLGEDVPHAFADLEHADRLLFGSGGGADHQKLSILSSIRLSERMLRAVARSFSLRIAGPSFDSATPPQKSTKISRVPGARRSGPE